MVDVIVDAVTREGARQTNAVPVEAEGLLDVREVKTELGLGQVDDGGTPAARGARSPVIGRGMLRESLGKASDGGLGELPAREHHRLVPAHRGHESAPVILDNLSGGAEGGLEYRCDHARGDMPSIFCSRVPLT